MNKLHENMRRFGTKNLSEQTDIYRTKCEGEVFDSDICGDYETIIFSIANNILSDAVISY